MSELVPLDKLFLPANIQKSVGKAIDILEQIEGKDIETKLTNIGKKYQSLTIKDISDEANYQIVHSALLDLQKVRVAIKKVGKSWRDNLTVQNREELKKENELLALFEQTETALREEKKRIDELKAIEERRVLLPMRSEMLKKIDVEVNESEILLMDEKTFAEHYKTLKEQYDELQEIKRIEAITKLHNDRYAQIVDNGLFEYLDDKYQQYGEMAQQDFDKVVENAKLNQQKSKEAEAERARVAIEEAKKEAEEKAKQENDRKIRELKEKAKADQQRIIDEQLRKEQEAKEAEETASREKEQERLAELEEREKAEKNKKYINWKIKNDFNAKTDIIKRDGNTFIMYKFVSKITFE